MIQRNVSVCRISDLPPGKAVSFRYGISNGIAYNDNGTIKAYVNRCTHMGGTVDLVGAHGMRPGMQGGCDGCIFRCRMHFAEFDPATGMRTAGQAPEGTGLKPISLTIEGDQVSAILEMKEEFE